MKRYTESYLRTIAKVVTWRLFITVSHVANALIVTGNLALGLKIAGLALIINSLLFWSHDRLWNIWQWNRRADDRIRFYEGHPRSLGKLISWRVVITASNFVIPFLMTGSWGQAAVFAGLATVVNMVLYWSHERLWNLISWGRRDLQHV